MNKIPGVLFAIALTSASTPSFSDIKFSGFGSFIIGISDNDEVEYAGYDTEDFTFDPDSLIGLQAVSPLSDKITATIQLAARAENEWDVEVDWAYISYQIDEKTSWRLGRFRVPFYLYSEYITVNYAYPWISPPFEVYNLNFSNLNGADILYQPSFGSVDALFQAYIGSEKFEAGSGSPIEGSDIETRNQFGLVAQLSWQSWETRFAYHAADVHADTSVNAGLAGLQALARSLGEFETAERLDYDGDYFDFYDFAVKYDNGTWLGVIETILLSGHDEAPNTELTAYFATGGYRFGDSQVHVSWSQREDNEPDLVQDIDTSTQDGIDLNNAIVANLQSGLPQERENITLGYRWDFAPKTAFKAEISKIDIIDQDEDVLLIRTGINIIF